MNMRTLLRNRSGAPSPIGLDIGTSRIKAAQLRRAGNGWELHAFAAIPRPVEGAAFDATEAGRVNDVLFRQGFEGNRVVLAVPDGKLLTVNLELPPRNQEIPLDQIARAEFARSVKTESDPFEFAYWDLPAPARATKSTHVMGVGCRHLDSEPIVEALEMAGFEVAAIDVEAAAVTRACASMLTGPQEITALVDLGCSAVRMFVIHQGVVTYRRSLGGHGMRALRATVADQIDVKDDPEVLDYVLEEVSVSDDPPIAATPRDSKASHNLAIEQAKRVIRAHFDAVLSEVKTSLSYAAHQYPDAPVKRLLLTGGGASLSGLSQYLGSILNVETRAVRCADLVAGAGSIGADDIDRAAAYTGALAIGLAQVQLGCAGRTRREGRAS
jgi:type IV pilus assembly protein PilM